MERFFRRPGLVVAAILVITAVFAVQIPDLEINNNIKIFIPEDNPSRVAYEDLQDDFGSQEQVDIAVTSNAASILRPDPLSTIREITGKLEDLPTVESVQSVTNADFIEATGDGMRATTLLEEGEITDARIEQLTRRVLTWPEPYEDSIVSADIRSTQILVTLVEDAETAEREQFHAAATEIISDYEDTGLDFYMAGDPVITVLLKEYMLGDLLYLIPLVTIVVLLALFLSFRNLGGVVLPIITVLISTVWALGVMSLLDIYFSMISTVIPVLLIAVGSAYVIHIFNHYYDSVRAADELTPERHRDIVFETLRKIGIPVIMSALTTAAGFSSIATSTIVPMRHFGIINAVGVVSALIVTLTFVPALLLVRRTALRGQGVSREGKGGEHDGGFSRALLWFYGYFSGRSPRIIFLSLVVVGVSIFGLTKIVVDNSLIEYFQRDSEIRVADRFIRENFSGTKTFSIVISGDEPAALTNPEALAAMDELKGYLSREYDEVGKVVSYSDFIRRMNQVMNIPPAASQASGGASRSGAKDEGPADDEAAGGASSSGGDDGAAKTDAPGSFFSESSYAPGGSRDGAPVPSRGSSRSGSASRDRGLAHLVADGTGNDSGAETGGSDGGVGSFFGGEGGMDSGGAPAAGESSDAAGSEGPGGAAGHGRADSAATPGTVAPGQPELRIDRRPSYRELMSAVAEAYGRAEALDLTAREFVDLLFRELNYGGAAYDEIPTDPEKYPVSDMQGLQNLVSQYLLLYSGSLDDFADDSLEPQSARMYVVLEATNSLVAEEVSKGAKEYAVAHFPEGYDISIAGFSDMESEVTRLIVNSQLWSLFSALVVVFVIVSLANRSAVAGLYGIVPLTFAILINFGVMGISGIKLNIATAMIASIAIGIGIDYTIHFLTRYRIERAETDDLREVTKRSILTTGKAILYNAFAVAAGFAVLIASNFNPLRYVGVLVALTMLTSSIAALTILPVLLNLFRPRFVERGARVWSGPAAPGRTGETTTQGDRT
ncbi:MAG: MMPL family transporter [Spirochaetes bacterium]|jgi:predicted RND superfamily exporter protein|nr:MMPL family transporter [Spirochaetota bacterium]